MAEKVTFKGASEDLLAARIECPLHPKAFVLFAHCFTCGKDLNTMHYISHALLEEQIGLFRFGFTGLGASAGDFANTNFSSNV